MRILAGATKHRGRGMWPWASAQFGKSRKSQLLLAFLCMPLHHKVNNHKKYTTTNINQSKQTSRQINWFHIYRMRDIYHAQAYQHWRRQLLFTEWDFPSCADNSTKGDCCRWISSGAFHLFQIMLVFLCSWIVSVSPQSWSAHVDIQNRLCKEAHSVSLQICFFYDFILTFSYCGPDAPTFEKSDFEKGKVRILFLKLFSTFTPK